MRRLGATWWESEEAYFHNQISTLPEGADERTNNYIRVGWPAGGGVWVWKTTRDEASEKGGAKLQNANSMEERCELIKMLGGVLYADPKACPYLDFP